MGRFKSVLIVFLLAEIFFVQTMAARSMGFNLYLLKLTVRTGSNSKGEAITGSDSPISSPSTAESPKSRSSSEAERGEESIAEPPEVIRTEKHHSSDKSVAGGGVIIGGLVTAIFAAVYCYIRVTRKRVGENH